MKNPPPKNPRENDTWIDDNDELHVWDGTNWIPYEDPPSALDVIYRGD